MQETTFNSPYQVNGDAQFTSIHLWLSALYSTASQKNVLENFDFNTLLNFNSVKLLESSLGYQFKNKKILINAFTQSTFCYEFRHLKNSSIFSNERLEFLGDSLVNLIVAKILYTSYPNSNEGELSKLRGALVNEISLAKLASSISLGESLLLGKGEFKNFGNLKESILADAFEALCAAIYIDSEESVEVLENAFLRIIKKYELDTQKQFFSLENLESFDSKSQLQELSVSLFQTLPTYKFSEEKNIFTVELWIGERKLAVASGPSKKKLEKELARLVLDEKKYQL